MSVLSDAANALSPGQWTTISSSNINTALAENSSGVSDPSILPYTNAGVWSPTSAKLIYGGSSHWFSGSPNHRLAVYDEPTNSWSQSDPAWQDASVMHSYDHMSINTSSNTIYYFTGDVMREVAVASDLGGSGTTRSIGFGGAICGTSYFPDIGKVVLIDSGRVRVWTPGGTSVSQIASGLLFGEYHNVVEYSAGKQCVVFGGGVGSKVWYKGVAPFTGSSHITRMPDAPHAHDIGDGNKSIVIPDPATGNILFFFPGGLYSLDPTGNGSWAQHTVNSDLYSHLYSGRPLEMCFGAPCSTYNVVFLVQHRPQNGTTFFRIYKHGNTPAPPPGTYTITTNKTAAVPGDSITLSWSVPAGRPVGDWVHLIRKDLANASYDPNRWVSAGGQSSGSFTTTAPAASGTYVGRYVQDGAAYTTLATTADIVVGQSQPPQPPPNGLMPTLADEKAAYNRWGWTWQSAAEPSFHSDPGYVVSNPDIHGDTEGDDLWSYTMMYNRTGQLGYLHRATAWANYFKNSHLGSAGYQFDKADQGNDHCYGWGLIAWHERQSDQAAINTAIALATDVESIYGSATPGSYSVAYWGTRGPGRHLHLATRLAEATGASRWITLRNKLIDLFIQSPDWDATRGMHWYGQENTDRVRGSESYSSGVRAISSFEIGVAVEGLWQAYRTTGRADVRSRLMSMATFALNNGMGNLDYTGSFFGINDNGSVWHTGQEDPAYTLTLVNLLVIGYKLSGQSAYLDQAKHNYHRANGGVYGQPSQRSVPDGVVHHFVDSRFDSSTGNFYLWQNKGELQYSWMIFEGGGAPTVEGSGGGDTTPPVFSGTVVTSTHNSIRIVFNTNELASTKIDWGLTVSYGSTSGTFNTNPRVTAHSYDITGLTAGTTYNLRATVTDAAGNTAVGGNIVKATTGAPDTTGPVLTNVQVTNISQTGAVLTLTTDELATVYAEYGTTLAYGSSTSATSLGTTHSIPISGLTAVTQYNVRARATDQTANPTTGSNVVFTTLPAPPPAATRRTMLIERLRTTPQLEYKAVQWLAVPIPLQKTDPSAKSIVSPITAKELQDIRDGKIKEVVDYGYGATLQEVMADLRTKWEAKQAAESSLDEFADTGKYMDDSGVWRTP